MGHAHQMTRSTEGLCVERERPRKKERRDRREVLRQGGEQLSLDCYRFTSPGALLRGCELTESELIFNAQYFL